MNEIEIAELHDKIFAHLYQKYLDAKERGEEFYFLLAPRYGFGGGLLWDIAGRFYWLNWMDGRGSIQLNFMG